MKHLFTRLLLVWVSIFGTLSAAFSQTMRTKADFYGTGSLSFTSNINWMQNETLPLPLPTEYAWDTWPNLSPDATTQNRFLVYGAESNQRWYANPVGGAISLNQAYPFTFVQDPGIESFFTFVNDENISGASYTFRIRRGNFNTRGAMMRTSAPPRQIAAVTQSPLATEVKAGQSVTVTATLNLPRSPEERFFLKYTTDTGSTFPSFRYVRMAFSAANDLTGEALIPSPALPTRVRYMVVSSTVALDSLTQDPNFFDQDLLVLRTKLESNGNFFQYDIQPGHRFRVSLINEIISPDGVFLAGSFNGFSPTAMKMVRKANDVFEAEIALPIGTPVTYKFINGSTWESVPESCGVNDGMGNVNRSYTATQNTDTIPRVCFSRCTACAEIFYTTTVRVDMSGQTVSPQGMQVVGTFWNGAQTIPMTSIGNNRYEAVLSNRKLTFFRYRFQNGNTVETVPFGCGIDIPQGSPYQRSEFQQTVNRTLDPVCFSACNLDCATPVPTVNITIRVNMQNQTVSPSGVFLAGSFNNWSATATPMFQSGNTWEAVVTVPQNQPFTYKFVNGSAFENVPALCATDDGNGNLNRRFVAGTSNTTLPLVCFGECANCNLVSVTLRVNMATVNVSPSGVFVATNLHNYSVAGATPMVNVGGAVYEATLQVPGNTTLRYSFMNGNSSSEEPNFGLSSCASQVANIYRRSLPVTGNVVVPAVCFGDCDGCFNRTVTFRVDMQGQTVSPQGVRMEGYFSTSNTLSTRNLTLQSGTVYSANVVVESGALLRWRFLNGTTAETVPAACGISEAGVVFRDTSVLLNAVTSTPCFGSCAPCQVVVLPKQVTFRVNMSNQTVAPSGVKLAGSFNGFSTTATPMNPVGNNVYEVTLPLNPGAYTFKYVNGATFEEGLTTCGVGATLDRSYTVSDAPSQTLPTVCYGRCDNNCAAVQSFPVTFRVNMTNQPITPDGVKLAGSFNGFSTTATPMSPVGNNVYEVTVSLSPGTYTYKFVNASTFEGGLTACGTGPTLDRQIVISAGAQTLPTVCFGRCDNSCAAVPTYPVAFRVNVTNLIVSSEGIKLAGSFNGFSITANPMTPVGNNVYADTLNLAPGTYTYKFVNGAVFESGLAACGVGANLDRQVIVGTAAQALPEICFSACDLACTTVSVQSQIAEALWKIQPNPASSRFSVLGIRAGETLEVVDVLGKVIYAEIPRENSLDVNSVSWPVGVYRIRQGERSQLFWKVP